MCVKHDRFSQNNGDLETETAKSIKLERYRCIAFKQSNKMK